MFPPCSVGSLRVPSTVQWHAITGERLTGDSKLLIGLNVNGSLSLPVTLNQIGTLSSVYPASCSMVDGMGSSTPSSLKYKWKRMDWKSQCVCDLRIYTDPKKPNRISWNTAKKGHRSLMKTHCPNALLLLKNNCKKTWNELKADSHVSFNSFVWPDQ